MNELTSLVDELYPKKKAYYQQKKKFMEEEHPTNLYLHKVAL